MTTHLDARALDSLDPRVAVPGYDRDQVEPGIVHLGVGAFHRSHQAMYVDRLLHEGDSGWGICGVGVLPSDRTIADVLHEQDGLYTLLTVDPDGRAEARVIGSHVAHLHAPSDPQAVVDRLADPATRIVSLTITEGGYGVNDATGEFEPRDPATLADLAGSSLPSSVLGLVVAALEVRRAARTVPFTVMSCDNIQGNGHVARTAVTAFARTRDADLADWIGQHVAFPSSMVDRITPATTAEVVAAVAALGVDDRWPVRSESFTQWVLEDRFSAGRPAFETVGVQVVDDVTPYELMKLRLLNASHQAMGYLGILAGETYVHDVCRDPLFVRFLLGYMHHEAIPTLRPVPGIDLSEYCDQLIARFSSEAIRDTLGRQVIDASDRIPKFLLPVVRAQLAAGREITRCALVLAAWCRYLEGTTDAGLTITAEDKRLSEIRAFAEAEKSSPGAFLTYEPVFGDLGSNPVLRDAFGAARTSLAHDGARAATAALA
ncbi:mannitol dehydrogenase family protein [Cellulomonas fengjieae]|uniref:Mannitol-1-phosphate 5-dehydrogenase n=1 Tax=Cellulomonas fengjieae TaxID=2819978 RepID=A0ABS3SL66_9CELL|nr:mannitol dehydrogenase family protein [Cellulomonas fengjieae]MBO3085745.1 mannitol dehydrogenase family protein [Cellulomonas fengjieae]QVI67547.1 mannitol dehydrogenase family protein [Cellulomonas fengjieae]